MIVCCDRYDLLGLFLSDHILIQLCLQQVRRRNIVVGENRLRPGFLFLLHLLLSLAPAAENVAQIQETDRRPSVRILLVIVLCRIIAVEFPFIPAVFLFFIRRGRLLFILCRHFRDLSVHQILH